MIQNIHHNMMLNSKNKCYQKSFLNNFLNNFQNNYQRMQLRNHRSRMKSMR